MTEEWRDIQGYEGHYQASTHGQVRSLQRLVAKPNGKHACKALIKKPQPHNKGYMTLHLYLGTKRQKVFVHRVIAMTFLPNPQALPIVNHKDRDRTNNRLENLEWCDESENQLHWRRAEAARTVEEPLEAFAPEDLPF